VLTMLLCELLVFFQAIINRKFTLKNLAATSLELFACFVAVVFRNV